MTSSDKDLADAGTRPPLKIIYIGGYSRSGSTLLDRMLGQLPGFFSTGELGYLTTHGIIQGRKCGCGKVFQDCPLWHEIGIAAFGGWDSADARELVALYPVVNRHRYIPLMVFPNFSRKYARKMDRYTSLLARLFAAIGQVGHAEVIVDSTVDPSRAFLLKRVPGVEIVPIQLIRDSRGVSYSWTKQQMMLDTQGVEIPINTFPATLTAFRWMIYHVLFKAFRFFSQPGVSVRYEDLVADPIPVLGTIAGAAGIKVEPTSFGFVSPGRVHLRTCHTIAGNNMRMSSGDMKLRVDEAWRQELPRVQRILVTAITWPMLSWTRRSTPAAQTPTDK